MEEEIVVEHLPEGESQATSFYDYALEGGTKLASDLVEIIESLKTYWSGSDATMRINELIELHRNFYQLIIGACNISADAVAKMRALLAVQSGNMGQGGNYSPVSHVASLGGVTNDIAIVSASDSAIFNPNKAKEDISKMSNYLNAFRNYKEEYNSKCNTLTANWTSGCRREDFLSNQNRLTEILENEATPAIQKSIEMLTTVTENYVTAQSATAQ